MTTPTDPGFILLYVDSPAASATFYTDLLGRPPVETSPTFVMFALNSGVMLGLWSRHTAEPAPTTIGGGGGELGFPVGSRDEVTAKHDDWFRRGLRIIQPTTEMDFGFTFVALDPDGHRLRVFFPNGR